jgi:hypothetical protein
MAMENPNVYRLEHFIALAKEGKDIYASVNLIKKIVTPTVHPEETEDTKSNSDMYLLLGEYNFAVAGEIQKVFKSYAFGTFAQSKDSMAQNIFVANERLKIDYQRLRKARIMFEEKYF